MQRNLTRKSLKTDSRKLNFNNSTILKNVLSEAEILKRKSKNVNEMIERGTKAEMLDHLNKVKVEDKRVTKQIDVKLITDKTIEALLGYFIVHICIYINFFSNELIGVIYFLFF